MNTPKFSTSAEDKKLIVSILEKIEKKKKNSEVRIIGFEHLFKFLSDKEKILVKKFRDINPLIFGFKGRYLRIQGVPKNLVAIRGQKYKSKDKIEKIETQYLPKPVFEAYKKLNSVLFKDIKKKLLVDSGYRSPAYQVITFLWYLNFHKFNFSKTIKRVAIPGYSEHGFPKGQAVDFITTDGVPNDEKPLDFAKTIEYNWLLKNADKFGFYQSYPRNNKLGAMFEPWHWQFRK
ncbi:MAG: D-alanyl-D-alanine carboxypeptidase family protein [Parcubacteria group bacterium]|nr:D-alanyl-D-alanine carboxypeptidase family protein [Parcubacteria group bacterium]